MAKKQTKEAFPTKTLGEVLGMPEAERNTYIETLTLGDALALTGLTIEVEMDGATPEYNDALTDLALKSRPSVGKKKS
jgi:hypothetical protein